MHAHFLDEAKARANLESTVAWRRENVRPGLHCPACAQKDGHHSFYHVGHDRFGRPIMYCSPARCASMDNPDTMLHLIAEQERAFLDPDKAECWMWIFDCRGLGLFSGGLSVSVGKEFVRTFTDHYPNRLSVSVMFEPPTLVDWLYSALKPFMDPETVRKNVVVKTRDLPAVLAEFTSSGEQTAWLTAALTSPTSAPLPPLPSCAPLPVHRMLAVSSPTSSEPAGGDGARATPAAP
jgi:hypothetical protein